MIKFLDRDAFMPYKTTIRIRAEGEADISFIRKTAVSAFSFRAPLLQAAFSWRMGVFAALSSIGEEWL